jgi:hypothetical protein
VQHLGSAIGVLVQLVGRRAFGAERALVVRAPEIALDVHDLVADGVDDGGAADGAVGADAGRGLGVLDAELLGPGGGRRQAGTQPEQGTECSPGTDAGGRHS